MKWLKKEIKYDNSKRVSNRCRNMYITQRLSCLIMDSLILIVGNLKTKDIDVALLTFITKLLPDNKLLWAIPVIKYFSVLSYMYITKN